MTHKRIKQGEQSPENPYGLTFNPDSCRVTQGSIDSKHWEPHPLYLLRFNEDGTSLSFATYQDGASLRWELTVSVDMINDLHTTGLCYQMAVRTSDQSEEPYLNIKNRMSGKTVKNLQPGQVYNFYRGQLVSMPTPSSDPLIKFMHLHGLRESDLVITEDPKQAAENSAISASGMHPITAETRAEKISEDLYACIKGEYSTKGENLYSGVYKIFVTEEKRHNMCAEGIRKIQQFYQHGNMRFNEQLVKPTWLLVAEMNLAEKLGPAIAQYEKSLRIVETHVRELVKKCHPLKDGDHRMDVVRFIRVTAYLGVGKAPFFMPNEIEGIKTAEMLCDIYDKSRNELLHINAKEFSFKPVTEGVYHVHKRVDLQQETPTTPLFSIKSEDFNAMANAIERNLASL
jgi:hypothetical protein